MPMIFEAITTDLSRFQTIQGSLRSESRAPELVVFGSSILMSGIDGRQLSEQLPNVERAYNLSSTGQSLVESYLLQRNLPPNVKTVVQMASAKDLSSTKTIESIKYNALSMYGFRPDKRTRQELGALFGKPMTELLERSETRLRFQSRWAVRQFIDSSLRQILRKDLEIGRAISDVYHPTPYTQHFDSQKVERLLHTWIESWPRPKLELVPEKRRLIELMAERLRERGREFVILQPPMHPAVLEALQPGYMAPMDAFLRGIEGKPGVRVIRAAELLNDGEFFDHIHPDDTGARRLTALVAQELRGSS